MNKTIILFHGWGGSKQSLTPLSEKLRERGWETYVCEMPGHGETPAMERPWSMEDFGKWALREIRNSIPRNRDENPILFGHSFGGKILLELATSGVLDESSKIILCDASGVQPKNPLKKTMFKAISKMYKPFEELPGMGKLRKSFYRNVVRENDYAKTEGMVRESFKLFIDEHYDNQLRRIQNETLILWGENDTDTPLWMGKKLETEIPNATLSVFEDTHGLPLHRPQEVAEEIERWVNKD